jgi:hypothetical protein
MIIVTRSTRSGTSTKSGHEAFGGQHTKPPEDTPTQHLRCALGFKPPVSDCRGEDRSESITG